MAGAAAGPEHGPESQAIPALEPALCWAPEALAAAELPATRAADGPLRGGRWRPAVPWRTAPGGRFAAT